MLRSFFIDRDLTLLPKYCDLLRSFFHNINFMNLHCKPQSLFSLAILHNFKGNIVLIISNYKDISIDPLKVNFVTWKETSKVISLTSPFFV